MIGVTGLGFFGLTLFPGTVAPLAALAGTTPLMLAVFIGAIQNILSKSAKYSLFDPCKEMAYIPLDQESKTKGKAAIDVIGNPLGKSGGAMIQQVLIFAVGSLAASTPVRIASLVRCCLLREYVRNQLKHMLSRLFCAVSCGYSICDDICVVQSSWFAVRAI